MPSLIPGYEYDIFISYRHNDNLDGWVTNFVQHLENELRTTLKDRVSVYFDKNPHDGLLESHNVDKSLESKLRCLVFIPVVSQTYCDPKSFAWRNEFVPFKQFAGEDQFGLHVTLSNGNVASRILPVRIHDLDPEDQLLLETELGPLRPIDFIFRSPGVNRPLVGTEDHPHDNLNKTFYRDQINKTANAIKDLLYALQKHHEGVDSSRPPSVKTNIRRPKRIGVFAGLLAFFAVVAYLAFSLSKSATVQQSNKSIAVLPFVNLINDPEQEYFSDGITEDILNHLTRVGDLKVKSRTSSQKYKESKKTIPEIGNELGVSTILQGSVRKQNNMVRVAVQLIDVESDVQLWSVTYNRELKDIFAIQDDIALEIVDQLKAELTPAEREKFNLKKRTPNLTAYNYVLKARELLDRADVNIRDDEIKHAELLLRKAIELDPGYGEAYIIMAEIYLYEYRWTGVPESIWYDSALAFVNTGNRLDPTLPDGYLIRWDLAQAHSDNPQEGIDYLLRAYELAPGNEYVLANLGWHYLHTGRHHDGADMLMKSIDVSSSRREPVYFALWGTTFFTYLMDYASAKECSREAIRLDPSLPQGYITLGETYAVMGQYDSAIYWYKKCLATENIPILYDMLGWAYLMNDELDHAEKSWEMLGSFEKELTDSTQYYVFRHRLGYVKMLKGYKNEGMELILRQRQLDLETNQGIRGKGLSDIGSHFYDIAAVEAFLGNKDEAFMWLDSALNKKLYLRWWRWIIAHDPLLENIRNDPGFVQRMKIMEEDFQAAAQAFREVFDEQYRGSGPLDDRILK